MFNSLRIAAAAPHTQTGRIDHNTAVIIETIKAAGYEKASLLILPENAVTGECGADACGLRHVIKSKKAAVVEIKKAAIANNVDVFLGKEQLTNACTSDYDCCGIEIYLHPDTTLAGKWSQTRRCLISASKDVSSICVCVQSAPTETVSRGVHGGGILICANGAVLAERMPLSQEDSVIYADIRIPAPSANPFFPSNRADYPEFCREIFAIQTHALAGRLSNTGLDPVINVSGGLDSALALCVCAAALDMLGKDRKNIQALILPGFGTSERTLKNARALPEFLGAYSGEIDIKPACLQHFKDIGHAPDVYNTTYENTQARERTQIALNVANMRSGMMIGTGNMSEIALGFSTFGGDALSMYNPNCGLTKTAVIEVVRWISESGTFGKEVSEILDSIIQTPISPELLPPKAGEISQITEKTVGPYELVDFFLYHTVKKRYAPKTITAIAVQAFCGKFTDEEVRGWLDVFNKRFFGNAFKRFCMPEGPRIFDVFLSADAFYLPGDVGNLQE